MERKISKETVKSIKEEYGYDFAGLSWAEIFYNEKLSESFIEKYADKVNWHGILQMLI